MTNTNEVTIDYLAMKDHELHDACGVDAKLWADAFCQYAKKLYGVDLDNGWMIGWFANPIMAMHDKCKGIQPTILPDGSAFIVDAVGE
jgi:hypothetical protein